MLVGELMGRTSDIFTSTVRKNGGRSNIAQ